MNECVQCGYCCTVRPCFAGVWNAATRRCEFLTEENKCAKYDEIRELEKNDEYPMFGCGCSSSLFNTVREAKIKEIAMNDPREKMRKEAEAKHGDLWHPLNEGKLLVFDRDEAIYVDKDTAIELDVILDGENIGPTKCCGALDDDVIARNMGWMPATQCGRQLVDMRDKEIEVDKEAGVVRLRSK